MPGGAATRSHPPCAPDSRSRTTPSDWDRYDPRFRPSRQERKRLRRALSDPLGHDLPVVRLVRWIARIFGTGLLVMVVVFAIGERSSQPLKLRPIETAMMTTFLTISAGLAIAWKREGIGGGLILGGYIVFALLNFFSSGHLWLGGPFPLFPIVGFLYLFCWRQSIRARGLEPSL